MQFSCFQRELQSKKIKTSSHFFPVFHLLFLTAAHFLRRLRGICDLHGCTLWHTSETRNKTVKETIPCISSVSKTSPFRILVIQALPCKYGWGKELSCINQINTQQPALSRKETEAIPTKLATTWESSRRINFHNYRERHIHVNSNAMIQEQRH